MSFTSIAFFSFFFCVLVCYLIIPEKWRWVVLLVSSYIFYASWQPQYVLLLLLTTLVIYLIALQIEKGKSKPIYLFAGLTTVLGSLFIFKYFNFFYRTLADLSGMVGIGLDDFVLDLLPPLGISFYTLQIISYLIDVYRGQIEAERHIGKFALFVSFFPQIMSGPISRGKKLLPQFHQTAPTDEKRLVSGFQLILWGSFQKLVISNRLAELVNIVYDDPKKYTGLPLIIATYLFGFQIFTDFNGYSTIAVGLARILGYDLVDNFKYPYISKDVAEFWNCWHISLSYWLRDYIFYPITRFFRKEWARCPRIVQIIIPTMVTMLISGLWHGAYKNYLIWGGIHGALIILSVQTSNYRMKIFDKDRWGRFSFLASFIQIFITFNLVAFAWIFFRSGASFSNAIYIIENLFVFSNQGLGFENTQLFLTTLWICILGVVGFLQRRGINSAWLERQSGIVQMMILIFTMISILFLGQFEVQQFIYAQF